MTPTEEPLKLPAIRVNKRGEARNKKKKENKKKE